MDAVTRRFSAVLLAVLLAWGCGTLSRPDDVPNEIPEGQEPPHGYSVTEDGQVFQTNFDLRRRAYLGVSDGMHFDLDGELSPPTHSLVAEIGFLKDHYVRDAEQRRRRRLLEGRIQMAPVELDMLLIEQEFVEDTDDPGLWIAFPYAELRIDIPVRVGLGWWGGRLHFRTVDDEMLLVANAGGIYMNWEFFGGNLLEDYMLFRFGVGGGMRAFEGIEDPAEPFVAPELGFRTAWAFGQKGLTHLGIDARYQPSFDLPDGEFWSVATAGAYLEQVLFAISDNPTTLFVQPEVRYDNLEFADEHRIDYRLFAGARFNMFVPPRPPQPGER